MEIVRKGSGLDGSVPRASGPLFIGSYATIGRQTIGLRELLSIHPYVYSSYATPSDTLLKRVDCLFVYDIQAEPRRLLQLAECCKFQRKHGGITAIYAVLRVPDDKLVDRIVNELGAQFRLLGELGIGG